MTAKTALRQDKAGTPERHGGLVSVGIVTWNSARDLGRCLDGLQQQDYPKLELLLVDNASTDESVHVVEDRFPGVRVMRNARNEGYSRAHNSAIGASQGNYYLPLNPDVELLPGFITQLVRVLEAHPDCGSATGKFWRRSEGPQQVLDSAGLFIDRRRRQYLRGNGEIDAGQFDRPEEVFGADGAAPLLRRSMLEDTRIRDQYFDEQFFAYMEDVDLAWRARILGWKCWYEPSALAVHDRTFIPGSRRTLPRSIRRGAVRNRYLAILKNESAACYRRDWWRIHWYDLQIASYILLFERSSLGAYSSLKARWSDTLEIRREIWKMARASERDMLEWFR